MKINQKIQQRMKEMGIESIAQLHREIQNLYEGVAITRPNLYRIMNNLTKQPRLKLISQIATILECPISDFYEGKPQESRNVYHYNDLAQLVNLNYDLPIKPQKILLKMGGKTNIIQEKDNLYTWVLVYLGEVVLHLMKQTKEEKIRLSTTQHYCFDGTIPHFYESHARSGGRLVCVTFPMNQ